MKIRTLHYAMLLLALVVAGCASTVDEPIVKGGDVTLTVSTLRLRAVPTLLFRPDTR